MYVLRDKESGKHIRLMTLFSMKAILDTDNGSIIVFDTFAQAYEAISTLYFSWNGFDVGNTYHGSLDIVSLIECSINESRNDEKIKRRDGDMLKEENHRVWIDDESVYTVYDNIQRPVYWDDVEKYFYL